MTTNVKERPVTTAIEAPKARTVDMKLEIVVIPVSDVDRAKRFYSKLGWRLDADFANGDDFRVIQFTPPGSGSSVIFGKNVTAAAPGSAQGLYLIVSDIEAARDELLGRGVEVSEVFHGAGDAYIGTDEPYLFGRIRVSGPDPGAWQLPLVRLVQRSRRQRLAVPGSHDAIARPRRSATRPSRPRPISRARCVARLPPMASTRSAPVASTMRTGPTGTPSTSSGSRPASSCRHE